MKEVPVLHTARCILTVVTQVDIPMLREILDDADTKRFLPELAKTPADHPITDDVLRESFDKWIEQYATEKMSLDHTLNKDKFIYLVHVGDLYDGNEKRGYLIEITDDTEHQERVADIERYNMSLNRELMAKAKLIRELEAKAENSSEE